jgi:hypothetical protein
MTHLDASNGVFRITLFSLNFGTSSQSPNLSLITFDPDNSCGLK